MSAPHRLIVFIALLFAVSGCKSKEGKKKRAPTKCERFVERFVKCNKSGDPGQLVARCETNSNSNKSHELARGFACLDSADSCAKFSRCLVKLPFHPLKVSLGERLASDLRAMTLAVEDDTYLPAIARCARGDKDVARSSADLRNKPENQSQIKRFYQRCVASLPGWLAYVRDNAATLKIAACDHALARRSGIKGKALEKMLGVCGEFELTRTLGSIRDRLKSNLNHNQFDHRCHTRWADDLAKLNSESAKQTLARFLKLCFQNLGWTLLSRARLKLTGQVVQSCPKQLKPVAAAFTKWKLTGAHQKATIEFFTALCSKQ